jgi:hypothetical protein
MRLKEFLLVLLVVVLVFSFVVPAQAVNYYYTNKAIAYAYVSAVGGYLGISSTTAWVSWSATGTGTLTVSLYDFTTSHQYNTISNPNFGAYTLSQNFNWSTGSTGSLTASNFGMASWTPGHIYKVVYSAYIWKHKDYDDIGTYINATWTLAQQGTLYFTLGSYASWTAMGTSPYPITFDVDYTSFNCFTNRGIFTITRSNYYAPVFSFVATSLIPAENYVLSYDYCSTSNLLTVQFKSTIPRDTSLNLLWTVHGYDYEDNLVELSGNSPFTITCGGVEEVVPIGELIIISPETGANFVTETVDIPYKVVYGGDVTNSLDNMYGITTLRVDLYKDVLQEDGFVLDTDYSIVGNTTVWQGTATLTVGGDGNYRIGASMMSGAVRVLTAWAHTFTIGEVSTGNELLDWLKALWQDMKDWFVAIIKFLLVPSQQQLDSINITGSGSVLLDYLPFMDLSSYGNSELVFIDFSNVEIIEGINMGADKAITFDLDNANITGLLTYIKIGLDILISIFVIFLIFKILAV